MSGNKITKEMKIAAEKQIMSEQQKVDYDIRDFTIGYLVQEFHNELFYIPPYQRDFIWTQKHRSQFIESVILGLPVPFIFVAETEDGQLEVVDGAQRIQTIESFITGDLKLNKLDTLNNLNGFTYEDLPTKQQNKFKTKALRIIVLEEQTSLELRQEIFRRINTSGSRARPSEIRRGAFAGEFMDFIKKCAKDQRFIDVCPISKIMVARREDEELVLRFFAYSDNYNNFKHDVDSFLDTYAKKNQASFPEDRLEREFEETLKFVNRYIPNGFAKSKTAKTTPRVRFEAIAVGVNLALRENPNLVPKDLSWLDSQEFKKHVTTHASNSLPRLKGRIEFVRDKLLGA